MAAEYTGGGVVTFVLLLNLLVHDTNVLGNLLLRCAHQICGICNTVIEDVVLQFLVESGLCSFGFRGVPRPMPTTLSLAVSQTIESSASRISPSYGESSLHHLLDWLEDSLALVDTNAKSPTCT